MVRRYVILLTVFTSIVWLASGAFADQRSYVWTYEYKTQERGKGEVEAYFTLSTPDMGRFEGNVTTEHQLELEVGMTDRFDFSVYQKFGQNPGKSLEYKGFKLRARYRFGEKGRFFVDPLVYVEYKGKPDFSEHGFELKMIIAKDIGGFNFALNPVLEIEYEDGEWELEPEYAAGTNFAIIDLLRVGMEAKGSRSGHYLGPVVSHGTKNLWVALGSGIKIGKVDEGKPELMIRTLLGIGL